MGESIREEEGRGGEVCFFQAEEGIRDRIVTGVQTCALPIYFSRKYSVATLINVKSAIFNIVLRFIVNFYNSTHADRFI